MQERQVTIGDTTYPLPKPFLVLATQNPIEQEGTYPLPEAQTTKTAVWAGGVGELHPGEESDHPRPRCLGWTSLTPP